MHCVGEMRCFLDVESEWYRGLESQLLHTLKEYLVMSLSLGASRCHSFQGCDTDLALAQRPQTLQTRWPMVRPVHPFCECRLSLVCVNNRLLIESRRDGVKPRWLFPTRVLEHAPSLTSHNYQHKTRLSVSHLSIKPQTHASVIRSTRLLLCVVFLHYKTNLLSKQLSVRK